MEITDVTEDLWTTDSNTSWNTELSTNLNIPIEPSIKVVKWIKEISKFPNSPMLPKDLPPN